MIVTCGQCDTQFRLDESTIGPAGLRVRCSICKSAFLVEAPVAAAGDRVHEVARRALERASEAVPGVTDDLGELASPAQDAEESEWVFDGASPFGGGSSPSASEPEAPRARPAGSRDDLGDDLGSPEQWDFFTDRVPDSLSERAPAAFRSASPGEAPARAAARAAPRELEEPPRRRSVWLRRAGEALGWASVVGLFLGGLHTGVAPSASRGRALPASQPVGSLVAERVSARWLENAFAGPIYVISGQLRNPGSATAPAGELVAVRLVDGAGAPLDLPAVAVGPALGVEQLREGDPAALRLEQEQSARRLAGNPLSPGQRRRFDAVLSGIPDEAAGFRFEALRAPPEPAEPGAGDGAPLGGEPTPAASPP